MANIQHLKTHTPRNTRTLAKADSGFEPDIEFQAHVVIPIIPACQCGQNDRVKKGNFI